MDAALDALDPCSVGQPNDVPTNGWTRARRAGEDQMRFIEVARPASELRNGADLFFPMSTGSAHQVQGFNNMSSVLGIRTHNPKVMRKISFGLILSAMGRSPRLEVHISAGAAPALLEGWSP